jgi:hypothetical protein
VNRTSTITVVGITEALMEMTIAFTVMSPIARVTTSRSIDLTIAIGDN